MYFNHQSSRKPTPKKKKKKKTTESEIRRQNQKWFCSTKNVFGEVSMEDSIEVTRFGAGCVEVSDEVCSWVC